MSSVSAALWQPTPGIFASVFGLTFLAELPDKTACATCLLATRRHPVAVFLGAAGAFVVQSAVAVSCGSLLALLPAHAVRIGTGLLFLAASAWMWVRREHDDEPGAAAGGLTSFGRVVWTSFAVVFIAEWGDLTQLTTAALAAKYGRPLTVFCAATSALWAVSALAAFVGHKAHDHLHSRQLHRGAAVALALVGLFCLMK
jgi:putative Ca2+/H+ antiporter (TMEM165/GDT1 family)